jgi:hypothetical protein
MTERDISTMKKSHRKARLKALLSGTDYKVIKCYEAQLAEEEMPYDLKALLAERKAWRTELQQIMSDLSVPPSES